MTACPCCSNYMVRHVRQREVYWFCRSCWQEMPVLEQASSNLPALIVETIACVERHEIARYHLAYLIVLLFKHSRHLFFAASTLNLKHYENC